MSDGMGREFMYLSSHAIAILSLIGVKVCSIKARASSRKTK